ncbi:hypothetical protein M3697_13725 [Janibacter melonis]|uniref:hypothetical protein n=1 Tax=Janibacter melonis TaxID=262209 RepID=UPI001E29C9A9|nr:hypothetical protein [Janibacter melonis]MCB5992310.1 hypothetical protein [Janibacter melonis]MCM3556154.1 hypothetical protein [Janibacter melonis]
MSTDDTSEARPDPDELLKVYLRRHLAASAGGVDLFRRVAGSIPAFARDEVVRLADDVAADRRGLLDIAGSVGVTQPQVQETITRIGQQLGRLHPAGTLLRRSPLTDVIELEAMKAATNARILGFRTLQELSDPRLDQRHVTTLLERALDQEERIELLRVEAVHRALRPQD